MKSRHLKDAISSWKYTAASVITVSVLILIILIDASSFDLRLRFQVVFLVLALSGLSNSLYLFWKHRQKAPLLCPLNHDCSVVTESSWSHFLGLRNEVMGIAFFSSMLLGGLALIIFPPLNSLLLLLFLVGGIGALLFSLFLIYVQFFVIQNYCFYCLISAGITLLLLIYIILLNVIFE